ncbi:gastrin/cholecystokinin-like peptide [Danio aesculapii]|uniref:gastrin/cholecystokinin-like peptide n=1 Tax=Danio aesculapii TaxID=1142201 RepID=UPI0024C01178|nr:gastrin/cholecystokinin-like peptide [Danio aesculapii]
MMAKFIVLTLVAMLVVACAASPLSKIKPVNTKRSAVSPESPPEAPESLLARVRRSVGLSEDQRELMSRQLLQALSEIIQREDCLSDYQGWVDFGRRSSN